MSSGWDAAEFTSNPNSGWDAPAAAPAVALAPKPAAAAPTAAVPAAPPAAKPFQDDDDEAEPIFLKQATTASRPVDSSNSQVQVKLAAGLEDSPIYRAVSSFEDLGLNQQLLKGIYGMGFQRPSKIQENALPLLLANPPKDLIGQSQSGTGKTASFALAMLSRVDTMIIGTTQAICLAPARELANQIYEVAKEMGKFTGISICLAVPDSIQRDAKVNDQVVIGTPGTVLSLITRRCLDISMLKIFVLDEADTMLEQQSLGDQCIRIKNYVTKSAPASQIALFSATFTEEVHQFAEKFTHNANTISLRREELSVDTIKQFYMDCADESEKLDLLIAIYGLLTIGQSIIFVQKRITGDEVARSMSEAGHTVASLHGGYEAAERDRIMDDFRTGKCKVLVTTNVLARGIDILQVNLVVNYDLPVGEGFEPDYETYLHRIGRTGRFGRSGVSINFIHDKKSYDLMQAYERHFGRTITRVPTEDFEVIEKLLKNALR